MVDYSSLENYRTERYRGFESLSLRNLKRKKFILNFFFCFISLIDKIPQSPMLNRQKF